MQRRNQEKFEDSTKVVGDGGDNKTTMAISHKENVTTRVLFCRDTYDYPAELLLEPLQQQRHRQNATVLVNHMGMYTLDAF